MAVLAWGVTGWGSICRNRLGAFTARRGDWRSVFGIVFAVVMALAALPARADIVGDSSFVLSGPATSADGSITLTWIPGTLQGAQPPYTVLQTQDQVNFTQVYSGSGATVTLSGRAPGVYYFVAQEVIAYTSGSIQITNTGQSNAVMVTVLPPAPLSLLLSTPNIDGGNAFNLTWQAAATAVSYELQQAVNGGSWVTVSNGVSRNHLVSDAAVNGTYTYRVRGCVSAGCGNWSATLTVSNVIANATVPASETPAGLPSVAQADINAWDAVGSTEGQFRVDESGASTYSIALFATAGTAGVTPQLSLNYNSQGGNGQLGQGWSLSGLSEVSRCRQTKQQDNNPLPITWSNQDRFCLDGQRLVFLSSDAGNSGKAYGDPGTVYHTEIETYATITALGGTAGHPDYFKVEKKDGSVSFYGNAPGSRDPNSTSLNGADATTNGKVFANSDPATKTMTWRLRKFQDNIGNPIWYVYGYSNGWYLGEVRYAYGVNAGPDNYNARIIFTYDQTRPDYTNQGYTSGYSFTTNRLRLNKVTSENAGTAVRTYNLTYKDAETIADGAGNNVPFRLSRMTSIQECGLSNVCLPATQFTWASTAGQMGFNSASVSWSFGASARGQGISSLQQLDMNGDGCTDFVWLETNGSAYQLRYAISNCSGGWTAGVFDQTTAQSIAVGNGNLSVADYNGDGRSDTIFVAYPTTPAQQNGTDSSRSAVVFLSIPQADGTWRIASSGISTSLAGARFGDMNADGMIDIYGVAHSGPAASPQPLNFFIQALVRDTTQAVSSNHYYVFGTPQSRPWPWPSYSVGGSPAIGQEVVAFGGNEPRQALELNGDGLTDFTVSGYPYFPPPSCGPPYCAGGVSGYKPIQIANSSISGWDSIPVGPVLGFGTSNGSAIRFLDLNGDGLTDEVGVEYGRVVSRINTGLALIPAIGTAGPSVDIAHDFNNFIHRSDFQVIDYNRDGFADLMILDESDGLVKIALWNPVAQNFDPLFSIRSFVNGYYTKKNSSDKYSFNYFLMDANGDGLQDLVTVNPEAPDTYSIQLAKGSIHPQVITKITNGLQAETSITYENLMRSAHYEKLKVGTTPAQYCTVNLPPPYGTVSYACVQAKADMASFYTALNGPWDLPAGTQTLGKDPNAPVLEWVAPVYVVTRVEGAAPATSNLNALGSVDLNAKSAIEYYYGEAKVQAGGRGMLGFQYVRTVDMQTGVITTNTYRQDFPFIGYPLKTEVKTADGKLIRTSNSFWQFQNSDGSNPNNTTGRPYTQAPFLPVLAMTVDHNYEPLSANPLTTYVRTVNDYDSFGNTLTVRVDTFGDNVVASKQTTSTYGSDNTMRRLGRLTQAVVVTGRPGQPALTRTSQFQYYCLGTGAPCGAGSSAWTGMLAQEIVEPTDAAYTVTTSYTYDALGNRASATVSASDISDRTTRWEYDVLGRYRNRTFNALEHKTEEVVSRNSLGQPTVVSGLNGVQVQYGYGPLGRKYLEYSNNGAYAITSRYSTQWLCPEGTALIDVVQKVDGSQTGTCYDTLARAVRSFSTGFNGAGIFADTEYDKLGRVLHRSIPFDLGTYTSFDQVPRTTLTYDLLGRVTQTKYPDGTVGTAVYAGLKTTYKDQQNHQKEEYKNALGELEHVVDHNGAQIQYVYFADGSLQKTVAKAGNAGVASIARAAGVPTTDIETTFTYDKVGRKTAMNDPDKGNWTYAYLSTGELKQQIDAKGQKTIFAYDRLSRMTTRSQFCGAGSVNDGCANGTIKYLASWNYDSATNGVGQLGYSSENGKVQAFAYDSLGRRVQTATSPTNGEVYYQRVTFDQYGRPLRQYDAAGTLSGVVNVYNDNGYLAELRDAASNEPYYVINEMDARGHVTNESNGAATTVRTYDPLMGRLQTITSTVLNLNAQSGMQTVQDLEYHYDSVGNIDWRRDKLNGNLTETFTYDELNRLSSNTVGTNPATTISYDSFGNIASKNGLTYTYGAGSSGCTGAGAGAGVHAALSVGSTTYSYDCNGNNTTGDGRTLKYSVFDKPLSISKGTFTSSFIYDTDRNLQKRLDNNNGSVTTTVYVGSVEKVIKPDASYELRRYVGGALITSKYNSSGVLQSSTNQYVLKDHLGSTDVIIDQHGLVVGTTGNTTKQKQSFDPWGLRRDTTSWQPLSTSALAQFDHSTTNKGFTGHEMVDELGIIHMGGRIYDPRIGRFLQADPYIQAPVDTQSYNRYSYIMNNPVNGIDPSGYFSWNPIKQLDHDIRKLGDAFSWAAENGGTLMAVACTVASSGYGAAGCAALITTTSTFLQGGTWQQALRAGAIAGASSYAFSYFGGGVDPLSPEGFLTIGSIGGITSMLQGGNFGSGFLSAGIGAAAGTFASGYGPVAHVATASVVGGTASALTGGKFANGAITAAFAAAIGEAAIQNESTTGSPKPGTPQEPSFDGRKLSYLHLDDNGALVGTAHVFCEASVDCAGVISDFQQMNGDYGSAGAVNISFQQTKNPVTNDIVVKYDLDNSICSRNAVACAQGRNQINVRDGYQSQTHVLNHEYGHLLGFSDALNPNSVMRWQVPLNTSHLSESDMIRLKNAYK